MSLRLLSSIAVSVGLTSRNYECDHLAEPQLLCRYRDVQLWRLSGCRRLVSTVLNFRRLCRPSIVQRLCWAKARSNGKVGMTPNMAHLRQVPSGWHSGSLPDHSCRRHLIGSRIVIDVTFQISPSHTHLFQCVPRSHCLTKSGFTRRADWLLPCNLEWHETCNSEH